MIRKALTMLIVAPLGVLLAVFMIANRHAVTVSLDPLGSGAPALSATLPLFVVIVTCLLVGVVAGGTAAWVNQSRWRRAARRLDADARALRVEREALKDELAAKRPMALPLPRHAG